MEKSISRDSLHTEWLIGSRECWDPRNPAHLVSTRELLAMKNNAGDTPLHAAVQHNQHEQIKILLEYGAEINSINNTNHTPLHLAVIHNNSAIVKLLIKNNADFTCKDLYNQTPISIECQKILSNSV